MTRQWLPRTRGIHVKTKDPKENASVLSLWSSVFGLWSPQLAFYRNAEAREAAMLRNLEKQGVSGWGLVNGKKLSSIHHSLSTSVLVAGGFHTEGITKRLREQKISYLTVIPQIDSLEGNHYRQHMQGDVSWKKYLKPENGKIYYGKAFARAARDRLLTQKDRGLDTRIHADPRISVYRSATDPRLAKQWRDALILDLAKQGRIEEAGEYTKYLDESMQRAWRTRLPARQVAHGERSALNAMPFAREWKSNLDRFIHNIEDLYSQKALTPESMMGLLKPAATPAVALSAQLSSDVTLVSAVSSTRKTSPLLKVLSSSRNELRTSADPNLKTPAKPLAKASLKIAPPKKESNSAAVLSWRKVRAGQRWQDKFRTELRPLISVMLLTLAGVLAVLVGGYYFFPPAGTWMKENGFLTVLLVGPVQLIFWWLLSLSGSGRSREISEKVEASFKPSAVLPGWSRQADEILERRKIIPEISEISYSDLSNVGFDWTQWLKEETSENRVLFVEIETMSYGPMSGYLTKSDITQEKDRGPQLAFHRLDNRGETFHLPQIQVRSGRGLKIVLNSSIAINPARMRFLVAQLGILQDIDFDALGNQPFGNNITEAYLRSIGMRKELRAEKQMFSGDVFLDSAQSNRQFRSALQTQLPLSQRFQRLPSEVFPPGSVLSSSAGQRSQLLISRSTSTIPVISFFFKLASQMKLLIRAPLTARLNAAIKPFAKRFRLFGANNFFMVGFLLRQYNIRLVNNNQLLFNFNEKNAPFPRGLRKSLWMSGPRSSLIRDEQSAMSRAELRTAWEIRESNPTEDYEALGKALGIFHQRQILVGGLTEGYELGQGHSAQRIKGTTDSFFQQFKPGRISKEAQGVINFNPDQSQTNAPRDKLLVEFKKDSGEFGAVVGLIPSGIDPLDPYFSDLQLWLGGENPESGKFTVPESRERMELRIQSREHSESGKVNVVEVELNDGQRLTLRSDTTKREALETLLKPGIKRWWLEGSEEEEVLQSAQLWPDVEMMTFLLWPTREKHITFLKQMRDKVTAHHLQISRTDGMKTGESKIKKFIKQLDRSFDGPFYKQILRIGISAIPFALIIAYLSWTKGDEHFKTTSGTIAMLAALIGTTILFNFWNITASRRSQKQRFEKKPPRTKNDGTRAELRSESRTRQSLKYEEIFSIVSIVSELTYFVDHPEELGERLRHLLTRFLINDERLGNTLHWMLDNIPKLKDFSRKTEALPAFVLVRLLRERRLAGKRDLDVVEIRMLKKFLGGLDSFEDSFLAMSQWSRDKDPRTVLEILRRSLILHEDTLLAYITHDHSSLKPYAKELIEAGLSDEAFGKIAATASQDQNLPENEVQEFLSRVRKIYSEYPHPKITEPYSQWPDWLLWFGIDSFTLYQHRNLSGKDGVVVRVDTAQPIDPKQLIVHLVYRKVTEWDKLWESSGNEFWPEFFSVVKNQDGTYTYRFQFLHNLGTGTQEWNVLLMGNGIAHDIPAAIRNFKMDAPGLVPGQTNALNDYYYKDLNAKILLEGNFETSLILAKAVRDFIANVKMNEFVSLLRQALYPEGQNLNSPQKLGLTGEIEISYEGLREETGEEIFHLHVKRSVSSPILIEMARETKSKLPEKVNRPFEFTSEGQYLYKLRLPRPELRGRGSPDSIVAARQELRSKNHWEDRRGKKEENFSLPSSLSRSELRKGEAQEAIQDIKSYLTEASQVLSQEGIAPEYLSLSQRIKRILAEEFNFSASKKVFRFEDFENLVEELIELQKSVSMQVSIDKSANSLNLKITSKALRLVDRSIQRVRKLAFRAELRSHMLDLEQTSVIAIALSHAFVPGHGHHQVDFRHTYQDLLIEFLNRERPWQEILRSAQEEYKLTDFSRGVLAIAKLYEARKLSGQRGSTVHEVQGLREYLRGKPYQDAFLAISGKNEDDTETFQMMEQARKFYLEMNPPSQPQTFFPHLQIPSDLKRFVLDSIVLGGDRTQGQPDVIFLRVDTREKIRNPEQALSGQIFESEVQAWGQQPWPHPVTHDSVAYDREVQNPDGSYSYYFRYQTKFPTGKREFAAQMQMPGSLSWIPALQFPGHNIKIDMPNEKESPGLQEGVGYFWNLKIHFDGNFVKAQKLAETARDFLAQVIVENIMGQLGSSWAMDVLNQDLWFSTRRSDKYAPMELSHLEKMDDHTDIFSARMQTTGGPLEFEILRETKSGQTDKSVFKDLRYTSNNSDNTYFQYTLRNLRTAHSELRTDQAQEVEAIGEMIQGLGNGNQSAILNPKSTVETRPELRVGVNERIDRASERVSSESLKHSNLFKWNHYPDFWISFQPGLKPHTVWIQFSDGIQSFLFNLKQIKPETGSLDSFLQTQLRTLEHLDADEGDGFKGAFRRRFFPTPFKTAFRDFQTQIFRRYTHQMSFDPHAYFKFQRRDSSLSAKARRAELRLQNEENITRLWPQPDWKKVQRWALTSSSLWILMLASIFFPRWGLSEKTSEWVFALSSVGTLVTAIMAGWQSRIVRDISGRSKLRTGHILLGFNFAPARKKSDPVGNPFLLEQIKPDPDELASLFGLRREQRSEKREERKELRAELDDIPKSKSVPAFSRQDRDRRGSQIGDKRTLIEEDFSGEANRAAAASLEFEEALDQLLRDLKELGGQTRSVLIHRGNLYFTKFKKRPLKRAKRVVPKPVAKILRSLDPEINDLEFQPSWELKPVHLKWLLRNLPQLLSKYRIEIQPAMQRALKIGSIYLTSKRAADGGMQLILSDSLSAKGKQLIEEPIVDQVQDVYQRAKLDPEVNIRLADFLEYGPLVMRTAEITNESDFRKHFHEPHDEYYYFDTDAGGVVLQIDEDAIDAKTNDLVRIQKKKVHTAVVKGKGSAKIIFFLKGPYDRTRIENPSPKLQKATTSFEKLGVWRDGEPAHFKADDADLAVSRVMVRKGSKKSRAKKEDPAFVFIQKGEGQVKIGKEKFQVPPGTGLSIPPGMSFQATANQGTLEFFTVDLRRPTQRPSYQGHFLNLDGDRLFFTLTYPMSREKVSEHLLQHSSRNLKIIGWLPKAIEGELGSNIEWEVLPEHPDNRKMTINAFVNYMSSLGFDQFLAHDAYFVLDSEAAQAVGFKEGILTAVAPVMPSPQKIAPTFSRTPNSRAEVRSSIDTLIKIVWQFAQKYPFLSIFAVSAIVVIVSSAIQWGWEIWTKHRARRLFIDFIPVIYVNGRNAIAKKKAGLTDSQLIELAKEKSSAGSLMDHGLPHDIRGKDLDYPKFKKAVLSLKQEIKNRLGTFQYHRFFSGSMDIENVQFEFENFKSQSYVDAMKMMEVLAENGVVIPVELATAATGFNDDFIWHPLVDYVRLILGEQNLKGGHRSETRTKKDEKPQAAESIRRHWDEIIFRTTFRLGIVLAIREIGYELWMGRNFVLDQPLLMGLAAILLATVLTLADFKTNAASKVSSGHSDKRAELRDQFTLDSRGGAPLKSTGELRPGTSGLEILVGRIAFLIISVNLVSRFANRFSMADKRPDKGATISITARNSFSKLATREKTTSRVKTLSSIKNPSFSERQRSAAMFQGSQALFHEPEVFFSGNLLKIFFDGSLKLFKIFLSSKLFEIFLGSELFEIFLGSELFQLFFSGERGNHKLNDRDILFDSINFADFFFDPLNLILQRNKPFSEDVKLTPEILENDGKFPFAWGAAFRRFVRHKPFFLSLQRFGLGKRIITKTKEAVNSFLSIIYILLEQILYAYQPFHATQTKRSTAHRAWRIANQMNLSALRSAIQSLADKSALSASRSELRLAPLRTWGIMDIFKTRQTAAEAEAEDFIAALKEDLAAKEQTVLNLASAPSQEAVWEAIIKQMGEDTGYNWAEKFKKDSKTGRARIKIIHFDELAGLFDEHGNAVNELHPLSFRFLVEKKFLRRLARKLDLDFKELEWHPINAQLDRTFLKKSDAERLAALKQILQHYVHTVLLDENGRPIVIDNSLGGIGEGKHPHWAFVDAPADFNTDQLLMLVDLTTSSDNLAQQKAQAAKLGYPNIEFKYAITQTMFVALGMVRRHFLAVPGPNKAGAVYAVNTAKAPDSGTPASIFKFWNNPEALRTAGINPDGIKVESVKFYIDEYAAAGAFNEFFGSLNLDETLHQLFISELQGQIVRPQYNNTIARSDLQFRFHPDLANRAWNTWYRIDMKGTRDAVLDLISLDLSKDPETLGWYLGDPWRILQIAQVEGLVKWGNTRWEIDQQGLARERQELRTSRPPRQEAARKTNQNPALKSLEALRALQEAILRPQQIIWEIFYVNVLEYGLKVLGVKNRLQEGADENGLFKAWQEKFQKQGVRIRDVEDLKGALLKRGKTLEVEAVIRERIRHIESYAENSEKLRELRAKLYARRLSTDDDSLDQVLKTAEIISNIQDLGMINYAVIWVHEPDFKPDPENRKDFESASRQHARKWKKTLQVKTFDKIKERLIAAEKELPLLYLVSDILAFEDERKRSELRADNYENIDVRNAQRLNFVLKRFIPEAKAEALQGEAAQKFGQDPVVVVRLPNAEPIPLLGTSPASSLSVPLQKYIDQHGVNLKVRYVSMTQLTFKKARTELRTNNNESTKRRTGALAKKLASPTRRLAGAQSRREDFLSPVLILDNFQRKWIVDRDQLIQEIIQYREMAGKKKIIRMNGKTVDRPLKAQLEEFMKQHPWDKYVISATAGTQVIAITVNDQQLRRALQRRAEVRSVGDVAAKKETAKRRDGESAILKLQSSPTRPTFGEARSSWKDERRTAVSPSRKSASSLRPVTPLRKSSPSRSIAIPPSLNLRPDLSRAADIIVDALRPEMRQAFAEEAVESAIQTLHRKAVDEEQGIIIVEEALEEAFDRKMSKDEIIQAVRDKKIARAIVKTRQGKLVSYIVSDEEAAKMNQAMAESLMKLFVGSAQDGLVFDIQAPKSFRDLLLKQIRRVSAKSETEKRGNGESASSHRPAVPQTRKTSPLLRHTVTPLPELHHVGWRLTGDKLRFYPAAQSEWATRDIESTITISSQSVISAERVLRSDEFGNHDKKVLLEAWDPARLITTSLVWFADPVGTAERLTQVPGLPHQSRVNSRRELEAADGVLLNLSARLENSRRITLSA